MLVDAVVMLLVRAKCEPPTVLYTLAVWLLHALSLMKPTRETFATIRKFYARICSLCIHGTHSDGKIIYALNTQHVNL